MKVRLFLRITLLLLVVSGTIGCMTYGNVPAPRETRARAFSTTLNYKVEGSALFAGPSAVRDAITASSPFERNIPAEKDVTLGEFLSVKIEQNPPSLPATVFGYVSLATLTILPFWSTQDGSTLTFTMYKNGTKTEAKEYVINRRTFVWLPMALVAWVNVFTPSEEEAFKACTRDFLSSVYAGK